MTRLLAAAAALALAAAGCAGASEPGPTTTVPVRAAPSTVPAAPRGAYDRVVASLRPG